MHADDESYDVVAEKMTAPHYPKDAQRIGAMGRVVLALRFDEQGKMAESAVIASMLYDTGVKDAAARRSLKQFEQAALEVSRAWRGKVIPGKRPLGPEGYTVTSAVVFTLSRIDLNKDGQWLPVLRVPNREIPWRRAQEFNDDGSLGGFVALGEGGPQLQQGVHGMPVL
jgi:hypothetical protein